MLRYVYTVILLVFAASIAEGIEVGDSALRTSITSGEVEIKFVDFHGKSNLIVIGKAAADTDFISQLNHKAAAFETKYDATVLHLQGEREILIIDKSGYVRWKVFNADRSAQSTLEELESQLGKLKRDEPLPIGSPAPDFGLVDVESGLLFKLSKYKGKKHILATLLLQTY